MAYVPQNVTTTQRPPDQSGSGGSFYALKAFFDANRPQGDAYAQGLVGPSLQAAQGAADATQQAAAGTGSTSVARTAKDNALSSLGSTVGQMQTPGQVEGYLQNAVQGPYSAGQSAADAYLVGRSSPVAEANWWQGVVGALNPMAPASSPERAEAAGPGTVSGLPGQKKRREVF